MVSSGHPLEVSRYLALRVQQAADGSRVMDRRVEVRVVADANGKHVLNVGLRNHAASDRLDVRRCGGGRALVQKVEECAPQCAPGHAPQGEEVVEHRCGTGLRGLQRQAVKALGSAQGGQVQDLVADGNAAAWRFVGSPPFGTRRTASSGSESQCLACSRSPANLSPRHRGFDRSCAWVRLGLFQSNAPAGLRRLRRTPCLRNVSICSAGIPSSPSTCSLLSPWK